MIEDTNKEGNSSELSRLWRQFKRYASSEIDYAKITATEKLTVLLSGIVIGAIIIVICAIALCYLSLSVTFALRALVGDYVWAFLIVAGILLVLALVIYLLRKRLIVDPLSRALSKLFLDSPDNNTDYE